MDNQYFQSEIHRLLKLGPDLSKPFEPTNSQSSEAAEAAIEPSVPFNLPIKGSVFNSAESIVPTFTKNIPETEKVETNEIVLENPEPVFSPAPFEITVAKPVIKPNVKIATQKSAAKTIGGLLVYPVVFILAFSFFYVVMNFSALLAQVQGWFAKDETEQILQTDLVAYEKWIGGYYFSVGDNDKLKPNNDIDFDGLTNLDEFTIKTNPTVADSDNDGINDGIEVINGTNPWGNGELSAKQKKLVEQLDMIKINNRISFNAAESNDSVLNNHTENFDMTKPGKLSIPKLNMQVPLIWTEDPSDFDNDLTRGVVHYPGTALPGELGTVYVSGHSSDYFWKNHPYKQVFAKINALDAGDEIYIDVYGLDGKLYNYKYVVTVKQIYAPDDQAQFIDNTTAKLNLSTCWPIGTQKDRFVVSAVLVNP